MAVPDKTRSFSVEMEPRAERRDCRVISLIKGYGHREAQWRDGGKGNLSSRQVYFLLKAIQ